MNQSFFIAAVGAHQQLKRLGVHGNNVANVNTYGFKAEKGRFTALMYGNTQAVEREDMPYGVGTALWHTDTDFTSGPPVDTHRDQDYMIDGDGFFAVVDLATNDVTLTRNGSFYMSELKRDSGEVDEAGQPIIKSVWYLSDQEGRFVLSETGGMIEMDPENPHDPQPVGIFDYNNYNGMQHVNDTRFRAIEKNGGLRVGTGKLIHGMLENSNVDFAEEISKVIETQRAYQMALRMVTTSDEIETTINGLRS